MFILLSLSLLGCDNKTVAESDCINAHGRWPNSYSEAFWTQSTITLWLGEADPSAALWVEGISGTSTVADDPRQLLFIPDEPLAPDTTHELRAEWCDGEETLAFDFTTATVTTAPESLALSEQHYVLEFSSNAILLNSISTFESSIFLSYLSGPMMAFSLGDGELSALITTADEEEATSDMPCEFLAEASGVYDASGFSLAGESLPFTLYDSSPHKILAFEDYTLLGEFTATGELMGELTGRLDVRDIATSEHTIYNGKTVCEIAAEESTGCVPCSDGVVGCLELVIGFDDVAASAGRIEDFYPEECFNE